MVGKINSVKASAFAAGSLVTNSALSIKYVSRLRVKDQITSIYERRRVDKFEGRKKVYAFDKGSILIVPLDFLKESDKSYIHANLYYFDLIGQVAYIQ